MPQVTVTIAGKAYRMACADGEEAHLAGLAGLYDGKIAEMRKAFGEIGDMRLHVMAALTIADELAEARRSLASLQAELDAQRRESAAGDARSEDLEARTAEGIARAAERIERLARGLSGAG
ncbi:MAG TPA: cell division protein ZapA [Microvirga sp.]|jgi:cell division protein ZapA|nr:cell division protein ZapA [Microvirga sp.]